MNLVQAIEEREERIAGQRRSHQIREHFVLTATNRLGSLVYRRGPGEQSRGQYLNLGCGSSHFDGWVNADAYKLDKILRRRERRPDWMLDATRPWNCPSDHFRGIFCEHVMEHLTYGPALTALRECRRTLMPGYWIRISVPDLAKYVRFYLEGEGDERFGREFPSGALAVSAVTQEWGHRSAWDGHLLSDLLRDLGFEDPQIRDFGCSSDPLLTKDCPDRRWESTYVEARKPRF